MANKKRLGTDAFDWLRDTRGQQDSEGGSEQPSLGDRGDGQAGGSATNDTSDSLKNRLSKKKQPEPKPEPKPKPKRKPRRADGKTSKDGLPENWTRATFIMREDLLEKFKDVAYWDRKAVKELFNEMLQKYILHRQRKDGEIKSRPKDKG